MSITVSQIIADVIPRVNNAPATGTTIYQAINYITSLLAKRLLDRNSDLMGATELSQPITAGDNVYDLPSGFLSFREVPFLTDGTKLQPLQDHRSKFTGIEELKPSTFELVGAELYLYPTFTEDNTLTARYYALPAQATLPADEIPFNGLLDQAYFQGVPRVIVAGLAVIQADADFERFLFKEVDTVLDARTTPLPERRMKRSYYF